MTDAPLSTSLADIKYMRRCLSLAAQALGQTSPNPHVGCVIVKGGKILSEGYHHKAGLPHAEIEALQKIDFKATGATLYCNLEPCYHQGRTPPCVDRVIASGVKRVVIAHRDPHDRVAGKSVRKMKKAGIQVVEGVCQDEARYLNRFFLRWITKKQPYVIVKVGVSADGKLARTKTASVKKNRYITSASSLRDVHQFRAQVDAILVGINTLLADDPQLNVRGVKGAKQPLRIVLDNQRRLPSTARVLHSKGGKVLCVSSRKKKAHPGTDIQKISTQKIITELHVPRGDIPTLLSKLGLMDTTSLLVEGGYQVMESFFKAKAVDEIQIYISPQIIGDSPVPSLWPLLSSSIGQFQLFDFSFCGVDLKLTWVRKSRK